MAVTPKAYGLLLQSLWEGRVNLAADPLMLMLVSDGYTPNMNTHKFKSIVIDEIVGGGYASGGQQVTGIQLTYESANKRLVLSGGTVTWPNVTFTDAKYGVLYVASPNPVTAQPLVAYFDFGELVDRTDEPFYVQWAAGGIMTQTVP